MIDEMQTNGRGRWSPAANAKRRLALRGRTLSTTHRAAVYATATVGRDDPDLWQSIYERRLVMLQVLDQILKRLSQDTPQYLPEPPTGLRGNTQVGRILGQTTKILRYVDRAALLEQLQKTERINDETILHLADWLGIPSVE